MRPIQFQCKALLPLPPVAIASQLLQLERWPEFSGYGPLPGILKAEFEQYTEAIVGTKIRVTNRDGSSHIEEIVVWRPATRLQLKMQGFTPPLSRLASHFLETWDLQRQGNGTLVTRSFELHSRGRLTSIPLWLISFFLKKAIARHLLEMQKMPNEN